MLVSMFWVIIGFFIDFMDCCALMVSFIVIGFNDVMGIAYVCCLCGLCFVLFCFVLAICWIELFTIVLALFVVFDLFCYLLVISCCFSCLTVVGWLNLGCFWFDLIVLLTLVALVVLIVRLAFFLGSYCCIDCFVCVKYFVCLVATLWARSFVFALFGLFVRW